MTSEAILSTLLIIVVVQFLFDQYLDFRDSKSLSLPIPKKLEGIYDDEKYAKSQNYHKEKGKIGLISSLISFVLNISVLYFGLLGSVNDYFAAQIENPIVLALCFFGIVFIVSDVISMPFSLYNTFVIEEKYGFNKTNLKTYLFDKLKGYFLGAILGGGILSLLLLLVEYLGSNFWIVFWIVIAVFMLLINMFYTSLIVPLFNKLTPLEDGELKTAINKYAQKVGFPLTNVYVIDGSKRSTKANAYFSGIGKKKKIVLYDTLIDNHTTEELVAVLAHEVGHFKKKHVVQGFVFSILQTGITLYILSLFINNTNMSLALGASSHQVHLNLVAFSMLFGPVSMLTGLFSNLISRKNEYEADEYAGSTYAVKPLQEALKKLSSDNLSNLTPDPLNVFLSYSHPPLLQRLEAMDKIKSSSK